MKPAPPPIIDLGARYQVIDETCDPPRWKTIGCGVACKARAREAAKKAGYSTVWILDGIGCRTLVAASEPQSG